MPYTPFCLSNLTTVLFLCLKKKKPLKVIKLLSPGHFPDSCPFPGVRHHPVRFCVIVSDVWVLIKVAPGGSELAPISVVHRNSGSGECGMGHVILFYLLSIIFDGLYSSNKISRSSTRLHDIHTLLPLLPMHKTHKNTACYCRDWNWGSLRS